MWVDWEKTLSGLGVKSVRNPDSQKAWSDGVFISRCGEERIPAGSSGKVMEESLSKSGGLGTVSPTPVVLVYLLGHVSFLTPPLGVRQYRIRGVKSNMGPIRFTGSDGGGVMWVGRRNPIPP